MPNLPAATGRSQGLQQTLQDVQNMESLRLTAAILAQMEGTKLALPGDHGNAEVWQMSLQVVIQKHVSRSWIRLWDFFKVKLFQSRLSNIKLLE